MPGPWLYRAMPVEAGTWDVQSAYRFCNNLARRHYENFPVVFGILGRPQQDALAAVYAFARIADDFADEPQYEGVRERLLDVWEAELERCLGGEAEHPVFIALSDAVKRYNLPAQALRDLLSAFRQDCRRQRYETFSLVLDYCRRSANPVGRLVLAVLGILDERRAEWSDAICTALQLTNFWQDLSVDIPRGRLYIPLEDLERFHVPEEGLMAQRPTGDIAGLIRFEVERTEALFDEGRPLLTSTFGPGTIYFGLVFLGGKTVLRMVKALGPSALHTRPSLGPSLLWHIGRQWIR